jgi:hypothetical protein
MGREFWSPSVSPLPSREEVGGEGDKKRKFLYNKFKAFKALKRI